VRAGAARVREADLVFARASKRGSSRWIGDAPPSVRRTGPLSRRRVFRTLDARESAPDRAGIRQRRDLALRTESFRTTRTSIDARSSTEPDQPRRQSIVASTAAHAKTLLRHSDGGASDRGCSGTRVRHALASHVTVRVAGALVTVAMRSPRDKRKRPGDGRPGAVPSIGRETDD
jgi:hypothetical protein